jgi:hypothetical protein
VKERIRQSTIFGKPPFPEDPNPAWWGYSVGHYEGDAFVVESKGFNDLTWLDDSGTPHSTEMRTIERFRRTDFGHMNLDVTIDDPMRLMADTETIEEVRQREGLRGWLGVSRSCRGGLHRYRKYRLSEPLTVRQSELPEQRLESGRLCYEDSSMTCRLRARIERLENRLMPESGDKLPLAALRHLADGTLWAEESRRWSALIAELAAVANSAEEEV